MTNVSSDSYIKRPVLFATKNSPSFEHRVDNGVLLRFRPPIGIRTAFIKASRVVCNDPAIPFLLAVAYNLFANADPDMHSCPMSWITHEQVFEDNVLERFMILSSETKLSVGDVTKQ